MWTLKRWLCSVYFFYLEKNERYCSPVQSLSSRWSLSSTPGTVIARILDALQAFLGDRARNKERIMLKVATKTYPTKWHSRHLLQCRFHGFSIGTTALLAMLRSCLLGTVDSHVYLLPFWWNYHHFLKCSMVQDNRQLESEPWAIYGLTSIIILDQNGELWRLT